MSTRTYRRSADIIGPYESGHGKKVYTVHQAKFEVEEYYDVLAAVGFGAYGMVCSALDHRSNRHVAIKKVPHVFDDLVDGLRVVREVKLLATLRHENILHLCDILPPRSGERYEDLYFVTDLFDTDLQQIVRSSQELSHDHRRYFMYQMLQALQHVHSVGVAHRDLKPSNLLVNANCNLVLCDFGLARPLHTYDASNSGVEHEEMTDYVVTRWYRAPELLLLSGRYTERVDTWSVGCIFAELILRKPLFPGRDYVHQIELIASVLGVPGSDRLSVTSCSEHDDASTEQNEKQEARDASCGRDLRFLDSVTENLHAQRYLASMATIATTPLREYLAPESVSVSELDLLEKLLHFIPGHRYSAEQALQHPYFSSLRVALSPMSESERAATGRKEFTVPIRCLDDPRSPVDTLHRPPFTPECSPSEAALESDHHALAREPSCPSKRWSWNLTREELTVSRLKESLLEEVRRFHPGCDTLV